MAHDAEGARRIAEAAGRFGRRQLFDKEGTQGLVLPLPRDCRLQEELAGIR